MRTTIQYDFLAEFLVEGGEHHFKILKGIPEDFHIVRIETHPHRRDMVVWFWDQPATPAVPARVIDIVGKSLNCQGTARELLAYEFFDVHGHSLASCSQFLKLAGLTIDQSMKAAQEWRNKEAPPIGSEEYYDWCARQSVAEPAPTVLTPALINGERKEVNLREKYSLSPQETKGFLQRMLEFIFGKED